MAYHRHRRHHHHHHHDDDAQVVQISLKAAYLNCGQNCAGGERFFVHDKVYDKFLETVRQQDVGVGGWAQPAAKPGEGDGGSAAQRGRASPSSAPMGSSRLCWWSSYPITGLRPYDVSHPSLPLVPRRQSRCHQPPQPLPPRCRAYDPHPQKHGPHRLPDAYPTSPAAPRPALCPLPCPPPCPPQVGPIVRNLRQGNPLGPLPVDCGAMCMPGVWLAAGGGC